MLQVALVAAIVFAAEEAVAFGSFQAALARRHDSGRSLAFFQDVVQLAPIEEANAENIEAKADAKKQKYPVDLAHDVAL